MNKLKDFLPVLHQDLEACEIEYAICGGMALWPYNVDRFTNDIDVIVSIETATRLKKLVGLGYHWNDEFPRTLRYQTGGVPIEIDILVEGFLLNEGSVTPNPIDNRNRINGVWFLKLETLMLMKHASGREKDTDDVKRLKEANV